MKDQATSLRAYMETRHMTPPPLPAATPAFVVGSGKGGVGKSVLSIGLATYLAETGRKTLLVDGAQNQGNLHVLLGLRRKAGLTNLLEGNAEPSDLLHQIADGIWLLPAESGAERLHALTASDRARLHHRLTDLYSQFDAVVIDAGGNLEDIVRVCAMRATRLVVVAVPEPAALSDAYAVIKILTLQIPSLPIDILVNRTENDQEGPAVYERLDLACQRFLHREINYIGAVKETGAMRSIVSTPGMLLRTLPGGLREAAANLLQSEGRSHASASAEPRV
ncbi:MAG: AAA family ATPase [Gemmatimonadota bacterium]